MQRPAPYNKPMKQSVESASQPGEKTEERMDGAANGEVLGSLNCVASRIPLPRLRYTLPDADRNIWRRLNQKIVDYLHKHGD
jgi:hypothetical protein